MEQTLAESWHEARARGGYHARWLAVSTLANFVSEGLRERLNPSLPSDSPRVDLPATIARVAEHAGMELRQAVRSLARRPGFSLMAILTLSLGVGGATAMFAVVHGILIEPLPYVDAQELVSIRTLWTGPQPGPGALSYPDLADIRTESRHLQSIIGLNRSSMTRSGLGDAAVEDVVRVTDGLMATLGFTPALGRDLRADEFGEDGPRVAVIGHGFWQAHFGGNRNVLKRSIRLDGVDYRIVGVGPRGFDYPDRSAIWIPQRLNIEDCGRGCHTMASLARLRDGVELEAATNEMHLLSERLSKAYPETNINKSFQIRSLRAAVVGETRAGLWMLFASVGLVLLIACANVANLLLVRATTRTGETAIRRALGASRSRLAATAMTESLVLALAAMVIGLALAAASLEAIPALAGNIPRMHNVRINPEALVVMALVVLFVTLGAGSVPAIATIRKAGSHRLGAGNSSRATDRSGARVRRGLLIGELALSALLLVAAGLLLRSFDALHNLDTGFETSNIVRFNLMVSEMDYPTLEQVRGFYRDIEERIRTLPDVDSVGSVWGPPLGRGHATGSVLIEGRPEPAPEDELEAAVHPVGPGFFETMRIPIVAGRGLLPEDDSSPIGAAVVNETFAKMIFPDEDPLGQGVRLTVSLGYDSPSWTIVGVAKDITSRSLVAEAEAEVYVPHGLFGPERMTLTVRTRPGVRPESLMPVIRRIINQADANVPLYGVETIEQAISRHLAPARFYLYVLLIFAGLAAILAAIGLYGVVSYQTTQKTREIGLRVAFGAERSNIMRLILAEGVFPAAFGLFFGLTAAWFGARAMDSLLFEVQPQDPWVFFAAATLLLGVAFVASLVPAWRASQISPATALRND